MFRVTNTDERENTVVIQGAWAQNSNQDVASLIFQNYDHDTQQRYDIAEIAARDAYGSADSNGYGRLFLRVSSNDALVLHGLSNTGDPSHADSNVTLDVLGTARVAGHVWPGGGGQQSASNRWDLGQHDAPWRAVYAGAFVGDGSQLTGVLSGGSWSVDDPIAVTLLSTFCNVGIGTSGPLLSPSTKLQVSGGNLAVTDGGYFVGDGSLLTFGGRGALSTQWTTASNASAIYLLNSNVGIGDATPATALTVQGTVTAAGGLCIGGQAESTAGYRGLVSSQWTTRGDGAGIFLAGGSNVGVGTTNPTYPLTVAGDIFTPTVVRAATLAIQRVDADVVGNASGFNGLTQWSNKSDGSGVLYYTSNVAVGAGAATAAYAAAYALSVDGTLFCTGPVISSSDARLKHAVAAIPDPLDKVRQLTGCTFAMCAAGAPAPAPAPAPAKRHIGLLAQDVERVAPEAVWTDPATDLKSVAYGNLVGLLVEAIKALEARVAALEPPQNKAHA